MFDLDKWQEIFSTMSKNKTRTILTGFSIFWGIFMLIILLGVGKGLERGVISEFQDDAINSLKISGGETSVPYKGMQTGRRIHLTNEDYDLTKELNKDIVDDITVRFFVGRYVGNLFTSYKEASSSFDIRCTHPDHQYMEQSIIVEGRFLNEMDMRLKRKVAVIGTVVKDALFQEEDPIAKYININGVAFKVIGVFDDDGGYYEKEKIYIPVYTAQQIFGQPNTVNEIIFSTMASPNQMESIIKRIRQQYARRHNFDPNDEEAIYIDNRMEHFKEVISLFNGVRVFIWIIGLGTLIAGIVGVSNIMFVSVKERTKEIGIRKSLGATPVSIVSLILQETLVVTFFFGYIGMVIGVFLIEMVAKAITSSPFFREPGVEIRVAIGATIILIISGIIAGFFPARKASSIKPVIALRDE